MILGGLVANSMPTSNILREGSGQLQCQKPLFQWPPWHATKWQNQRNTRVFPKISEKDWISSLAKIAVARNYTMWLTLCPFALPVPRRFVGQPDSRLPMILGGLVANSMPKSNILREGSGQLQCQKPFFKWPPWHATKWQNQRNPRVFPKISEKDWISSLAKKCSG